MKRAILAAISLFLTACATDITQIPVAGKAPACVRACSANYSDCIGRGSSHIRTTNACAQAYQVCTASCPQG